MSRGAFISHNKDVCTKCWQMRDGKCVPEPGFWCRLIHDYNPVKPVIPEAMIEEVQLR